MDDIGGEVGGALGSIAQHVGGVMKGEVRKLGQTAVSHVTGLQRAAGGASQKVPDEKHHRRFTPWWGELGKFGQVIHSQVTGGQMTARELSDIAAKDKFVSSQDYDAVHQKVLQIYREYEEKRKKQREKLAQEQTIIAAQKKQSPDVTRWKKGVVPNPAIAKTRAEMGKNYGTE